MPCNIKNPANYQLGNLEGHIHGMYDHFESKYGFTKPPTMVFDSDPSNKSNVLGKTAYYDPQSLEIHIFVDGRHPKDVLRSIAHELIHHRQNLEGRLDTGGYSGPGYYLENDSLKEVEHEAMLDGNATMREYEDTVKYKENKTMSLKEWRNNELNKQLLKKFGILKENQELEEAKGEKGDADPLDGERAKFDKDHDGVPDGADKDKDDPEVKEEGRNNPRTTNADKFVGHEDRYRADRIHEDEGEDNPEVEEEGLNLRGQKRDRLIAKAAAKVVAGSSAGAEAKNLMMNRAFKGMKPLEIISKIRAAAEEGLKAQEDEISKDFEQPASDMGAFIKSDEEKGPFAGLNEEEQLQEMDRSEEMFYYLKSKMPDASHEEVMDAVNAYMKDTYAPRKPSPPMGSPKKEGLQEAIRKIAKAKNIFLNGKRIK